MSNTTQLIQKVQLEQSGGILLVSVYKQHFLSEIDPASEALVFATNVDDSTNPFHYQLN